MSTFKIGGTSAAVSKRKLVIKPFKSQPQIPVDFEEQTWNKLQVALDAINQKTSVAASKEELCQIVEDVCRHRLAVSFYAKLSEHCRRSINNKVDTLHSLSLDEATFLRMVVALWREHCEHMSTIRNIFIYLDRTYALETTGVRPIIDMGTNFFRLRLEQSKELEKKLIVSAIAVIDSERRGYSVDRDALRQILRMLHTLGIYADKFEVPFIMQSRSFFHSDVQMKLPDASSGGGVGALCDYLSHVEFRLLQVVDMCSAYLDLGTRQPLISTIEDTMLRPHITMLLQLGAHSLFDHSIERLTDVKRLYNLCDHVQATAELRANWAAYIKSFGQRVLAVPSASLSGSERNAHELETVDTLLDFHSRISELLKTAFHNLETFKLASKCSFEAFFNEQETSKRSRPAELLCKFLDKKLCDGEKKGGLTEGDMEALLDRVLALFRFLQGQDAFEAFYKKTLARRLLLETSTNTELETLLVRKLKAECGANFTSKMEGMLADMNISRDVIEEYTQHIESHPPPPNIDGSKIVEAKIQVLTVGYWPTYPSISFPLPPALQASQDHFSAFYTEKYQGRRMTWVHFLSRCVLGATFKKGKKEFDVPLSQAVVMLLFNNANGSPLSFGHLLSMSQLEESLLKVCLHTLACGPPVFRLLEKDPKSKEILNTDTFTLVTDYSNKLFRIRYKHQEVKDSSKEDTQTQEEIVRERHHCIDAAIVRIMKSRKRLAHQVLLSEVMAQLRFPCGGADIKRRIETLIEREYLERDKDDNSIYNYLA